VSAPSSPSASSCRRNTSTVSVGFDDSESSDLTSYYCTSCDCRHELASDAPLLCATSSTPLTRKVSTTAAAPSPCPQLGWHASKFASPST
jgi:hypothetical protein